MDEFVVGPVPYRETFTQGTCRRSFDECTAFIEQIRRELGNEPEGASLAVRKITDYPDLLMQLPFMQMWSDRPVVVCDFDPNNPRALQYVFNLEYDRKDEWDEASKRKLGL